MHSALVGMNGAHFIHQQIFFKVTHTRSKVLLLNYGVWHLVTLVAGLLD